MSKQENGGHRSIKAATGKIFACVWQVHYPAKHPYRKQPLSVFGSTIQTRFCTNTTTILSFRLFLFTGHPGGHFKRYLVNCQLLLLPSSLPRFRLIGLIGPEKMGRAALGYRYHQGRKIGHIEFFFRGSIHLF